MSIAFRILVVDMLQSDIPIGLVTGAIILHAKKYVFCLVLSRAHGARLIYQSGVTALSLRAFIVHLCREKNCTGILKTFSDQAKNLSSSTSPLNAIMKELQLHTVCIDPRFQEEIKKSPGAKKGRCD